MDSCLSGFERVMEDFCRDVDILLCISHCFSYVMKSCMCEVATVILRCCNVIVRSSAYERTFILRFV